VFAQINHVEGVIFGHRIGARFFSSLVLVVKRHDTFSSPLSCDRKTCFSLHVSTRAWLTLPIIYPEKIRVYAGGFIKCSSKSALLGLDLLDRSTRVLNCVAIWVMWFCMMYCVEAELYSIRKWTS
jgi:hypothetical protein